MPKEVGGNESTNLEMAIIREHLARKGLGLHNDLQDESSIVGNHSGVHMLTKFGSKEQQDQIFSELTRRA